VQSICCDGNALACCGQKHKAAEQGLPPELHLQHSHLHSLACAEPQQNAAGLLRCLASPSSDLYPGALNKHPVCSPGLPVGGCLLLGTLVLARRVDPLMLQARCKEVATASAILANSHCRWWMTKVWGSCSTTGLGVTLTCKVFHF
jgi:hypothetical protein